MLCLTLLVCIEMAKVLKKIYQKLLNFIKELLFTIHVAMVFQKI